MVAENWKLLATELKKIIRTFVSLSATKNAVKLLQSKYKTMSSIIYNLRSFGETDVNYLIEHVS